MEIQQMLFKMIIGIHWISHISDTKLLEKANTVVIDVRINRSKASLGETWHSFNPKNIQENAL